MGDFNKYLRLSFLAACISCAVVAQAITYITTVQIAAALGTLLGLQFMSGCDNVSKHFQSDVDRILNPNDVTQVKLGQCALLGMIVAMVIAPVAGAAPAAVTGMVVVILAVMKTLS